MLMLKQSVNLSMCAVLIPILEDWSSLASFVQMGPCSIRSILFVNIGSMLTAPVLSHSSTSMKTLEIFLKILQLQMHHLLFQDMLHQHQHLQGHIPNQHQPHLILTPLRHLQQMNTLLHQIPPYQTMKRSLNTVHPREQEDSERASQIETKAANVLSAQYNPSLIQDHLPSSIGKEKVQMKREIVVFRSPHHPMQDQQIHLEPM